MKRLAIFACASLALVFLARAGEPDAAPVMVSGNGDLAACPSLRAIAPLRKGGDGFVTLRAAPSVKARMLDRLEPGRALLLCAASADGKWAGVAYPAPFGVAQSDDCGVSGPKDGPPRSYDGVCHSGWVFKRYVQTIAG